MPGRGIEGLVVVLVVMLGSIVMQALRSKNVEYECQECSAHFSPSPLLLALTPHRMGQKLLTCPQCGTRTWATPVPRDGA
ncbi:MAG: hypothetical protein M0000_06850 [Actinomycetota bacterium]|nr:hypothetical protein [Actinomycetota bacterium]